MYYGFKIIRNGGTSTYNTRRIREERFQIEQKKERNNFVIIQTTFSYKYL